MNKSQLLFLTVVLMLVSVATVQAADTRLNITMSETVYQNVTYAEDFYLTEATKICTIQGLVNITNPSSETVADIYLNFTNTDNMMTNFTLITDGRNGSQISGANPGDNFTLHIVELLSSEWSAFNYTINCSTVQPPLNLETNYSNAETGINRKVLAGHNWTVTQFASNDLSIGVPINNINVTIEGQGVEWNGTYDNFSLLELSATGDYKNVTGNQTSNRTWNWIVGGGSLAASATENITFIVSAPENVPTSATYMAIKETLAYDVAYLSSNLSLFSVSSMADLDFGVNKRIVYPSDNNNNTNVTWEVNPDVSIPFNISYNLTKVSVWVTANLDPSNYTTVFGAINTTYLPNQEVNQTTSWTGASWYFNYTDASNNVSNRPPIVWMRPYFTIMNAYNQIVNTTITQNGDDIYMKYIYVVNGYWLQIDKNITSIDADTYRIDTLVENIGNAWTPSGLVVTVYDFIPAEFAPWNWSVGADSTATVSGGEFNGTSYRWTISPKTPYNSSLGPSTETYLNRTWNVTYFVNGSGQYKVSELYIVGLDPRKVDGASAHQGITLVSAFGSASTEMFYAMIVLFLIAINIVNFVMTRKINKKLDKN